MITDRHRTQRKEKWIARFEISALSFQISSTSCLARILAQLGHTHPKTRECPATSSAFLPAENPSLNKCENGARMTKRHKDRNCETEGLLVPDQHAGYRFVDHFHRDQITPFEFIRLSGVS